MMQGRTRGRSLDVVYKVWKWSLPMALLGFVDRTKFEGGGFGLPISGVRETKGQMARGAYIIILVRESRPLENG